MKRQYMIFAGALLLSTLGVTASYALSPDNENDPQLTSIKTEIDRNMKGLKLKNMAGPFYIEYRMGDIKSINIRATRGNLIGSYLYAFRNGAPTVLVGDYNMNNLNAVTSYDQLYGYGNYPAGMVQGDNDAVIRTTIWKGLDSKYKTAAELYSNKKGLLNQMTIPEEERNIPDFQQMTASTHIFPARPIEFKKTELENYIKKASEVFKEYKELNNSEVSLYGVNGEKRYYNSEGTICHYPDNLIWITISTRSQTTDGQEMQQEKALLFESIEELPDQATLQAICKEQAELMIKKLAANMIKEAYVGPVLFEGEAVADLLEKYMADSEKGILAKRKVIASDEMSRYGGSMLNENSLESMVNKKVISRDLSLTSLTGTAEYKGKKLLGHYEVDAQGVVPDKELVLIEDGVLRNMLMNRTPTKKFRKSNGHARVSIDNNRVTLQPGVLRLSCKSGQSPEKIKKQLIAAAKEEDYPYAYIVRKINGDTPSELYRINVKDGSEELVRGANIQNMTLRSFKRVSAVGNKENICNRMTGGVKSTYIVPSSLLFDEVDIVRDAKLVLKKDYIVDKP